MKEKEIEHKNIIQTVIGSDDWCSANEIKIYIFKFKTQIKIGGLV